MVDVSNEDTMMMVYLDVASSSHIKIISGFDYDYVLVTVMLTMKIQPILLVWSMRHCGLLWNPSLSDHQM